MISLFAASIAAASIIFYPATMTVTSVQNDVVTLETSTGHVYEMDGAEDWMPGDIASLVMSDNGTPEDITDDVILSARYSGYVY